MSYQSIDAMQLALAKDVFNYAKDAKKAYGRALGTFVEILTFYLVKAWDLEQLPSFIFTHLPYLSARELALRTA